MLQNLVPHGNVEIRYNTSPVSIDVNTSCTHEADTHPVELRLVTAKRSEKLENESLREVRILTPHVVMAIR